VETGASHGELSLHKSYCISAVILKVPSLTKVIDMAAPAATTDNEDKKLFEHSIKALESQIANAGAHITIDSSTRLAYAREIRLMAKQLEAQALAGKITWGDAAKQAQETRNVIMEIFRRQSTPVGRAMAQKFKVTGYSLNELVARHASLNYGNNVVFNNLSSIKKDRVYASIVKSAGKSNPKISAALARFSHVGRALIVISLGISAYNIATSTDKLLTTKKEVLFTGAGIGGGIAGGALAGLACGPAAPVCVTMGAFVGGALAAFGVGIFQ
jgi:hypothetical protein